METQQNNKAYLETLKLAFIDRRSRRPHYSQNAFARDLGLSPARLSQILSGKSGLSVSLAKKISLALEFSLDKEKAFIDSVICCHSRSRLEREKASVRLKRTQEVAL